jgi:RNA polymerase sigma-32 factor
MERELHSYAQRLRELPTLSQPEEQALARRWCNEGDEQARNSLVQSQLRFVVKEASRFARAGAPVTELIAEGNLGLLHAANKFDPERGFRFFTYAKHWVRVFISRCASRSTSCVERNSRTLRKVRRELARATSLVGEGLEARRFLAERLKLSMADLEPLLCLLEQHEVPMDVLLAERRLEKNAALCSTEPSPEQAIVLRDEQLLGRALVDHALSTLDARERRIVDGRLMADRESILTLKQLGDEMGVSRERIRQLEVRVKRKLAEQLRSLGEARTGDRRVAA